MVPFCLLGERHMPNLSIKDVPDAWAEALRQRAIRNHRSLQGELMAIVEAAVAPVTQPAAAARYQPPSAPVVMPPGAVDPAAGAVSQPALPTLWSVRGAAQGPASSGGHSVRQVMAELRGKYPEPVALAPLGRDIIRAERDAR